MQKRSSTQGGYGRPALGTSKGKRTASPAVTPGFSEASTSSTRTKRQKKGPAAGSSSLKPSPAESTSASASLKKLAWNERLPASLVTALSSCVTEDSFKRWFLIVLAVATFKTRMVVHSVQPMLKVTLPPALHHATGRLGNWAEYSAKELVTILCAAHTKYANKFLNVIGADEVNNIRNDVEQKRLEKRKIQKAFTEVESVQSRMKLSINDICVLWAPLVAVIDPAYLDEPRSNESGWIEELETSSYKLIAAFSSGLLMSPAGAGNNLVYSERAKWMDLQTTSHNALKPSRWPVLRSFDPSRLPKDFASFRNLFQSDVPTSIQGFEGEDDESSEMPPEPERPFAESDMEIALTAAADDNEALMVELKGIADIPGAEISLQFDPKYVTEEASRIAQLNTAGLLAYTIARLERREKFYKEKVVWAHDRAQEAQAAKEYLIVKQEEARIQEERFREIMEQGTATKLEVRREEAMRVGNKRQIPSDSKRKGMLALFDKPTTPRSEFTTPTGQQTLACNDFRVGGSYGDNRSGSARSDRWNTPRSVGNGIFGNKKDESGIINVDENDENFGDVGNRGERVGDQDGKTGEKDDAVEAEIRLKVES